MSTPQPASAHAPQTGVFVRFMIAEFISMVGAWMQMQVQQLVVEEHATSSHEQAWVSFATLMVIPLFGPWAGTTADRFDRRRILLVVILIQALLATFVGWKVQVGTLVLWHLVSVGFIMGVTHAFEGPAYSALIPELVPREKIARAFALDRSVFHTARIIGPALAGIAVARYGLASAFYANAISFLGPLVILFAIPARPRGTDAEEKQRRTGFMDGWRHVRSDAPTFRMVLISAANALFCSPFVIVMLTWYGKRTLGLTPGEVGWLMACAGIGALTASVSLLALPHSSRELCVRVGVVLSVISMLFLAAAHGFIVACAGILLLTLGLNFLYGISNQIVQERAPDPLRGRVSAIAGFSFVAVIPFSGLMTSWLESHFGMRAAIVICACGYAVTLAALLVYKGHAARRRSIAG
ncbi:MAG: MFS transporter [Chthoniobacteraceae bacterium]